MAPMTEDSSALPAIRVGDAEREITARQLRLAVEYGQLTLVELDKRLIAVYRAETVRDLVAVTADLPVAAAAREPLELETSSGAHRKAGQWIVPSQISATTGSGVITIDFTEALCPHAEVAVRVQVGSGVVKLIVPRGWRVDFDRVKIGSGSAANRANEPMLPGSPVLRVEGRVKSGAVKAEYPRPPRRSFWAWLLRRPR
ncbi:hypothetical protein AWN90_08690 [Nocardia terpenica]|uniref:DUF1707 domain-containing protein n=2 Tax=Nocardia terpenica TaxID=455432 RepID=A0A164ILZ9_9NOCA|nr:hypothetical protein AWN90_08690 [Nocardia terpenica]